MMKMMMAITTPKKSASLMLFNIFKGTSRSSFLFFKTPFSSSELATGIHPSLMSILVAHFHSNSASSHEPQFDRPLSRIEKITKLDDALQLFDDMIQRQPLPSVVKFTQLLQAITKMQHYSCVIDLFKHMTTIGAPVNVYTTNIAIKCCCQMHCISEGFVIVAYGFRHGVIPDVYTFNTILNGLDEALSLFHEMAEKGMKPDVVSYSTMLQEMDERGFLLDASTLAVLLVHITPRSADAALLKLIGKLVPKQGADTQCFTV